MVPMSSVCCDMNVVGPEERTEQNTVGVCEGMQFDAEPCPGCAAASIPPPPQAKHSWLSSAATPSTALPSALQPRLHAVLHRQRSPRPSQQSHPRHPHRHRQQQQSSPIALSSPGVITSPRSGSDAGTGQPRLSSLNPSTSRFTRSILRLGLPKILLDRAVSAAVNLQEEREGSKMRRACRTHSSPEGTPMESTQLGAAIHCIGITNIADSAPPDIPQASVEDANTALFEQCRGSSLFHAAALIFNPVPMVGVHWLGPLLRLSPCHFKFRIPSAAAAAPSSSGLEYLQGNT
ncbi:hypothetical protein D9615_010667 [Tricholomella constricta]|uniref:Uncharacterized protein n=1 Tax=Tricholomella constricta TaxID=117010 RepID=A0A8H5GKD6_9AGAR|nr:hypothetical protein D9615_010667 [Tricholomella constricta]